MVKFFAEYVNAGFPSPADDFQEDDIRLDDYLVQNRPATFIVRVKGESMMGAGIFDGDLLVVDRSIEARHNHVILGCLNGEFTVKRLWRKESRIWLKAENPGYKAVEITEGMDFRIWGVVTFSIRHHQLFKK
ncbi:translesion error-prone DNA polymerase V autoproteolytic subunit [Limibacter armeniacum]|uniref:LexA family protein n=1 Tax=Limibacter armeniacum TaxID=466084 RepID=UPI002FE53D6A